MRAIARSDRQPSVAAMLHTPQWCLQERWLDLGHGLALTNLEGSAPERLYRALCSRGLDDGEPFDYNVAVLALPEAQAALDLSDPLGPIMVVANLVAAVTGSHPGMCRLFVSDDSFRTFSRTEELFKYGLQTEFLVHDAKIDRHAGNQLVRAHLNLRYVWATHGYAGGLTNAFRYFQSAWLAPYLSDVAVDLEIVHRICGCTGEHAWAPAILDIRSRLVSGRGETDLVDEVPIAFTDIARDLTSILCDRQVALAIDTPAAD